MFMWSAIKFLLIPHFTCNHQKGMKNIECGHRGKAQDRRLCEWLHVPLSLGLWPEGDCREESRAEAWDGWEEVTTELWCCALHRNVMLFKASSLFFSSLSFLFPLSLYSPTALSFSSLNLFWLLSSFISSDFPFPSPSFSPLFFLSSILSLPNGFPQTYTNLHTHQHF